MSKTYRVVGTHSVLGHKPGATFDASLPVEQEALLTQAGHIKVVPRGDRKQDQKGEKNTLTPPARQNADAPKGDKE